MAMGDDRVDEEPTQETLQGFTIPVPKRDDLLDALRKVAKAPDSPDGGRSPEK